MGTPVPINRPVLLLFGPLGLFFARLSRHLEAQGVPVYKLSLPLHEFGFRRQQRLAYSRPPEAFPATLAAWIERYSTGPWAWTAWDELLADAHDAGI